MTMRGAAIGGVSGAAAQPSAQEPIHALWCRRSVRVQLLVVFVLIDFVAAIVAGGVTILKARTSTRIEISASMELAETLVNEAVPLIQQSVPAERFLSDLSSRLRLVRHVRIGVKDATGEPLILRPSVAADVRSDDRAPAPEWFAALIAPPTERRDVPVVVNGSPIGLVEIASEPRDEIAEVWENTTALAAVGLVLNVAVIGILYYLFGRVLDPLTALAGGLADLEHQRDGVRLPRAGPRELAVISERFNALAQVLESTRAENARLNHRLITAQDDERRRMALELHDEVGPSLFGLKANAASIANAVAEGLAGRNVKDRVQDMLGIIGHLQSVNRGLLNRLRPMALGHVPLQEILAEMVRDRARQHPDIAFAFNADRLDRSYGDSIDLTIYRCVQESLTNVVRHAQAQNVGIDLARSAAQIRLTVSDDGQGIDPGAPPGFGLLGMRERVLALGGSTVVDTGIGRGTRVCITIPLREERSGAPEQQGVREDVT